MQCKNYLDYAYLVSIVAACKRNIQQKVIIILEYCVAILIRPHFPIDTGPPDRFLYALPSKVAHQQHTPAPAF